MEKIKIKIYEGPIDTLTDEDIDSKVNEFCESHKVIDIDIKPTGYSKLYIATIKYIETEEYKI